MLQIESIKRTYSQIVYQITDAQNHITFLVIEFSKDKLHNFQNEIICDALDKNQFPSWKELDSLICEIRRSGVLFL